MKPNDGGPAFPTINVEEEQPGGYDSNMPKPGMTLRQWYAGQALKGLVALSASGEVDDYRPKHVAHDAFEYADAMLAFEEAERRTHEQARKAG